MKRRHSPPALLGALIERAGLRRASRPHEPQAVEEPELPKEFDRLVRESFGQLIEAA